MRNNSDPCFYRKHNCDEDRVRQGNVAEEEKTTVIFQFTFGLEHFTSDRQTLLTRPAREGLGLHHILMFLSFHSAWRGYCNLMRPREHDAMIYNKIYFPRKWKDN